MKRILSIALAGALCASALVACGGSSSSTAASSAPAASSEAASSQAASSEAAEAAPVENGLQIGQSYTATSDYDYFTYAVAVVQGDTIVAAYLDDFQFFDTADGADIVGVPNSDADFGADYAEGKVLTSKRENAAYYSEQMAALAGSTVAIDANFDAIQAYAAGKTIDELTATADSGNAVDAVSGATLTETAVYLNAIAEAARNAQQNQAVAYDGDLDQLTLHVGYGAAHGTKCFTLASALTDGERIVLSYLDDLQFMSSADGVTGVPNSDGGFGANVAEGKVLASKRVNSDYYSANMAKAGSTVAIADNFDAIQNHLNGMTLADAEALAAEESPVDAISGATLADTAGYINAVLEAAAE